MSSGAPAAADYTGQIAQNKALQGSILGQAGQAWAQPLDNGQQARVAAQNALYGQATSRLDPQWAQREQSQQAQLAAQGLDNPSGQANQNAWGNFARARNDAYNQADFSAQAGGAQAAAQQQQLDLNARNAPLAAYMGLLSGNLGMAGQQFNQLAKAGEMNQGMWSGLLGGAMQLLGAGGGGVGAMTAGSKVIPGGAGDSLIVP